MNRPTPSGTSQNLTLPRAVREEVLQYFQDQGGEVKETAVYIHFVLGHHEEIPEILEGFTAEGLIQHKGQGYLSLTVKGKKALLRLRE